MSEESNELQRFLKEWRNELEISRESWNEKSKDRVVVPSKEENKKHISKWEDVGLITQEDEDITRAKSEFRGKAGFVSLNLEDENKAIVKRSKKVLSEGCSKEMVLLNLPNPELKERETKETNNKNHIKKQKRNKKVDENLLELLIADIDEINVIPFFDLQLPKEIGLKIFRHLIIQDLCQCAAVSKSWKNLAEDGLLWFTVGVKLGFVDGKTGISDHEDWKAFVHGAVVQERQLRSRWKERICRMDALEYERGGSLCAVSQCNNLLCAGYSSNAVLLWDTKDHQRATFKILERFSDGQEQQQHSYPTCTAVTDTVCAAGFSDGSLNLWHNTLSTSPLYQCHLEGSVRTIALSTKNEPTCIAASGHEMRIDIADVNGRWYCHEQKTFETQIKGIQYLPSTDSKDFIIIATRDTLHIKQPSCREDLTIMDHVIGGKITCFDCNADVIAVGVGPYGFGILGNTVRLYRSQTGSLLSILPGHYHEVTCLNLKDSPPQHLVTGSYDKRVRIYDLRTEDIALTLRGHENHVTTVQMDDWKVVSGAHDGNICVWDQRMAAALWHTHARHPVRFCHFDRVKMVSANIPNEKVPQTDFWADDLILHRRSRGSLRTFDFSSDNATPGVPEICSSSYDDTTGYNYNIALVTPYDEINE